MARALFEPKCRMPASNSRSAAILVAWCARRAFLSKIRGRSMIDVHEGGGPQLLEANKFINAHTIIECGGYGFVVLNHTHRSFPMTVGCCIGRSGPAAFIEGLALGRHEVLDEFEIHTGSQWACLSRELCRRLAPQAKRRRGASSARARHDASVAAATRSATRSARARARQVPHPRQKRGEVADRV